MNPHQPLSRAAYVYIVGVIAAGLVAIGYSALSLTVRPIPSQWLVLAALTLLTGSFSVKIPSVDAKISVSEAFVFASVLLFGPSAATLIVALDSFVMSMWLKNRRFGLRSVFNCSAVALSIWLAATAFFAVAQAEPGRLEQLLPLERHLWQLFVLASLYFVLNSWFVAIALAFEQRTNVLVLWWRYFPWFSLNYFGGVSVAALLVSYTRSVDLGAVSIILPLLLISYLTYRILLGRIEDSKRHVEHLNELYMSTIETLAMAVDAKDQITHGHIRRVQVYALELAKRLGMNEERQLKAMSAAALLHDMGKLAIPEHILNKPGKLTLAEFEKMKRHADIGADLLSSIKFPYPVVPIVRHHHEHWNGSGYPSGVSGTDIPLGARILAVVDCFDALTSDRPYRPRLTPKDAFSIIIERRGSMYDPLVVDTFVAAYSEIGPAAVQAGQEARSIFMATDLSTSTEPESHPLRQIRDNASEVALLIECSQLISSAHSIRGALEVAAQYLRQLTPGTVYALYSYDTQTDTLRCQDSAGDHQRLLDGLSIRIGERVSGWCAANQKTCLNSSASLDLGRIAELFEPALRTVVSTPLVHNEDLIGVLTAYSVKENAFLETDRYAFERIASTLVQQIVRLDTASRNVASFRGHTKI